MALGRLIFDAYHGTIDDEGETPEEAVGVVEQLFGGEFGALMAEASTLVFTPSGGLIAATLITYHRVPTGQFEGPFLAFSLTDPAWQRRGLARAGLTRAMQTLALGAGHHEIALVVTQGNPAEQLYAALGFR
jgi:GNAT superfamily N-acetyltransferase